MYKEQKPDHPLVALYVDCFWYFEARPVVPEPHTVLPDGAMDILFKVTAKGLCSYVSGAMTKAMAVPVIPGERFFGIRFRPGMAAHFLRINAGELTDKVHDISVQLDRSEFEDWLDRDQFNFTGLVHWVEQKLIPMIPDDPVLVQRMSFFRNVRTHSISQFANELGVSRKQFYRDFRASFGLAPRIYGNVRRLLKFKEVIANKPDTSLSEIALEAGFYDQADMTRQITKLTGTTPKKLSQLYNTTL